MMTCPSGCDKIRLKQVPEQYFWHFLKLAPPPQTQLTSSAHVQEGFDYFGLHNSFCERVAPDGWRTYVWASEGSISIEFWPSHVPNNDNKANILRRFDDFTVYSSTSLGRGQGQFNQVCLEALPFKEENRLAAAAAAAANGGDVCCEDDEEWSLELNAELGRLFLRTDFCENPLPWETETSYFTVTRSSLEETLLVIGPGSSGLQLFVWTESLNNYILIGILTGCVKGYCQQLLFVNVGVVASAVRLSNDVRFSQDMRMVGSLRYSLNMDLVDLWNATKGYKFAGRFGQVETTKIYRVAFLIYMCHHQQSIDNVTTALEPKELFDRSVNVF
jgi:hypothetical protein